MSIINTDLKYTKEHEWIKVENDIAIIGITDYAQHELGDIVFVETPKVGDKINASEPFGVVESLKTVSNLYMPVTGTVCEINTALKNASETINASPYVDGWIIKIKEFNHSQLSTLMGHQDYKNYIDSLK